MKIIYTLLFITLILTTWSLFGKSISYGEITTYSKSGDTVYTDLGEFGFIYGRVIGVVYNRTSDQLYRSYEWAGSYSENDGAFKLGSNGKKIETNDPVRWLMILVVLGQVLFVGWMILYIRCCQNRRRCMRCCSDIYSLRGLYWHYIVVIIFWIIKVALLAHDPIFDFGPFSRINFGSVVIILECIIYTGLWLMTPTGDPYYDGEAGVEMADASYDPSGTV